MLNNKTEQRNILIKKQFGMIIRIFLYLLIFSSFSFSSANITKERLNISLYLDSVKSSTTQLYRSYGPETARYIKDSRFPNKPVYLSTVKGYLDHESFTYDNGASIIALIDCRQFNKARKLLTILSDNFSVLKNGKTGLFNSYNMNNFNYFFPTVSGRMNLLRMGIDGSLIHLGPNIFIALAAQHYYFKTASVKFVEYLIKVFKWVQTFIHLKWPDNRSGGPSMGWGWGRRWQEIFSTENIIDYYAYILNMIRMHQTGDKNILRIMKNSSFSIKQAIEIKSNIDLWLKYFLFNQRGTFNRGARKTTVKSGKNIYSIDITEALDVNTFAVCGIGIKNLINMGIDPFKLILNTENKFKVSVETKEGKKFTGFEFTTKSGYEKKRSFPLIWWEGTAGMALACKLLSDYALKNKNKEKSKKFRIKYNFYMKEMNRFSKQIMKSKYMELPYVHKAIGPKEDVHPYNNSWSLPRGITNNSHLYSTASTVWRYFAAVGLNPFKP